MEAFTSVERRRTEEFVRALSKIHYKENNPELTFFMAFQRMSRWKAIFCKSGRRALSRSIFFNQSRIYYLRDSHLSCLSTNSFYVPPAVVNPHRNKHTSKND
jgi:hypothetical protein